MDSVFIIQRIDHEDDDETGYSGSTTILSAHTTLNAGNRAAKVLLHRLFRDDDDGEIAAITEEKIREDGTYSGTYRLSDEDLDSPDTNCVTVSVVKMDVKDEAWSPYEDAEDEKEFMKETGGFVSDAEGGDDCVSNQEDEKEEHARSSPKPAAKTKKNARTSSKTEPGDGPKKKKAKRGSGR